MLFQLMHKIKLNDVVLPKGLIINQEQLEAIMAEYNWVTVKVHQKP